MAEIRVPAEFYAIFQPPPICARSGRPARKRRKLEIVRAAPWTYFLLIFGVVPFVFAYFCTARRVKCELPISRSVSSKRSVAALGMFIFGLTLLVGVGGVFAEPGTTSFVVFVVGLAGLCGSIWLNHSNAVRGRWVDENTVVVKNLHPEFAAAALQAFEQETQRRMPVALAPIGDSIATDTEAADHQPQPAASAVVAAWYPDPSGQFDQRFWDGAAWTTQVRGLRVDGSSALA